MTTSTAAQSLQMNSSGRIVAVIPCDRAVQIGALKIEISALHRLDRMRVTVGDMRGGRRVQEISRSEQSGLNSINVAGYRLEFSLVLILQRGIGIVVHMYPLH